MVRQVTGTFCGLVSVAIPLVRSFPGGFGREIYVSIPRAFTTASVALALTSVTVTAYGQSPASQPDSTTSVPPVSEAAPQINNDRYRDGIVIWQTPDDARVPFLLNFNI